MNNNLFVLFVPSKNLGIINYRSMVIFETIFRYMLRDEKKEDDDWKNQQMCGVERPEHWISEEATVYSRNK